MVRINRIYTKTGDGGETSLVGGVRISKTSLRVCAYGEIDELNSHLGMSRTLADSLTLGPLSEKLAIIQNELFDIGAELATPYDTAINSETKVAITRPQIERLEQWIDEITDKLPPLTSFVLPGGTNLNAQLHISRAVCRRAERTIWELSLKEKVSDSLLIYCNRLSDLFFAFAREESNRAHTAEYLWVPSSS